MRIGLTDIWEFSEVIAQAEEGWHFNLRAGELKVEGISKELLQQLKNDQEYDTELLPSIFTFREILWQPDVFTESVKSLPGLRILQAYCEETNELYQNSESPTRQLYSQLLQELSDCCEKAISSLEEDGASVKKVLGEFRTAAFPIIKFFIYHPQNKPAHYRDAVNRLNYAVKVMLTQFFGKYTELTDPFWEVTFTAAASHQKSKTENS